MVPSQKPRLLPSTGPLENPDSYRPPILVKLFKKLYAQRLQAVVQKKQISPEHQFGLHNWHSTFEQVHPVSSSIRQALEEKKFRQVEGLL
mgnify:CR=1 FL=1